MMGRARLYLFGWVVIAVFVFAGSFAAVRAARTPSDPALPALVRNSVLSDGVRFVTAGQVLEATTADETVRPIIIDVRTSDEFAAAHISGALNIQDFQLPDAMSTLPGDRVWVLYCTCPDDRLAKWGAAAITDDGYLNAVVLQQGFQAWQAAGGPVTTTNSDAVSQGCGCSVEAEANKLFAINWSEQHEASRGP
jgi:rhodanese-related sulfurtransferase